MTKMWKRRAYIFLIVFVLFIGGKYCLSKFPSDKWITEKNWNIVLPKDAREIYHLEETGFKGDGVRYTVYECEVLDETSITYWSEYNGTHKKFIFECLNRINVPENKRISYEKCLYSYSKKADNSKIILLYDSTVKLLYVVEYYM